MASITDQNWVVWNQGKNPLVNFNFMLRVELMFDLPCKSVRAFSRELEYDYIQEGGLNDYVHMRRKPITRPFTLEIERYVGVDYLDPLPLGADLTLPVLLFVSRNHDQFIPGVVARTYVFTGCTVMKKTYGDLVADQSGLLVETTTLGYREMLCVDIPWSEVGDDMFKETSTLPTSAATMDKKPQEFKALAQDLYDQARIAKEQADGTFSAEDADALILELEETLQALRGAVNTGGVLEQQRQAAEKGLIGSDGRTKKELADESYAALQRQEETTAEALSRLREKDAAYQKAREQAETLPEEAAPDGAGLEAEPAGGDAPEGAGQEAEPAGGDALEIARQEAEAARKEYEAQALALERATEQARKDRDSADAAQRILNDVQGKLDLVMKQIPPLQNSLTNLKQRREKAVQAQVDCTEQHDLCKTANDAVQKLPDSDETAINSGYEEVKKYSKQACFHQRQVRDTCQHMEAARKLLEDVIELPREGETSGTAPHNNG